MKFLFVPMAAEYADEIVYRWHYDGTYAFYDMEADEDDARILLNKEYWVTIHRAVLDEHRALIGFASFYTEAGDFWLSLGLKPELTGQGLGEAFVRECVSYASSHYTLPGNSIKLAVARFNRRAIKVYRKVGFVESGREVRKTHIGNVDFLEMTLRC